MTRLIQATWLLPIILACAGFCLADIKTAYEWKYVDYVWKCDSDKQKAVDAGIYNYSKIITNDIQPLSDGRVLITTPRYFNNPGSLSTISDETGDGGPLLAPYPDWSWHTKTDCSGITSVNDLFLDRCNRLWLVDSGKIGNEQVCPAKILVFDATTDELLRTVPIPDKLSHSPTNSSKGRLTISSVETYGKDCSKVWVFISDIEGYGFLIWNGTHIWRLDDDVFAPLSTDLTWTINDESFDLGVGPTSSIITIPGILEAPALLFKPTASLHAFAVTLHDLHHSYEKNVTYYKSVFEEPSKEMSRVFSKKGVFVGGFEGGMIACWNANNTLATANIGTLSTDVTTLQWVSGIKTLVDCDTNNETVWITSDRLQKYVLGTMDFNEVNFRILTGDLDTLISGTVCETGTNVEVATIEDKDFTVVTSD